MIHLMLFFGDFRTTPGPKLRIVRRLLKMRYPLFWVWWLCFSLQIDSCVFAEEFCFFPKIYKDSDNVLIEWLCYRFEVAV